MIEASKDKRFSPLVSEYEFTFKNHTTYLNMLIFVSWRYLFVNKI